MTIHAWPLGGGIAQGNDRHVYHTLINKFLILEITYVDQKNVIIQTFLEIQWELFCWIKINAQCCSESAYSDTMQLWASQPTKANRKRYCLLQERTHLFWVFLSVIDLPRLFKTKNKCQQSHSIWGHNFCSVVSPLLASVLANTKTPFVVKNLK